MWNLYKYIYYSLYTWNKRIWGERDVPEFNAVAGMSFSFMCNLGSLFIIASLITGSNLTFNFSKKFFIAPIIIIMLAHYFAFMHNGKYREIEKEFKKESKEERKRKGFFVLLYTFGSLVFFIFMMFFWYLD